MRDARGDARGAIMAVRTPLTTTTAEAVAPPAARRTIGFSIDSIVGRRSPSPPSPPRTPTTRVAPRTPSPDSPISPGRTSPSASEPDDGEHVELGGGPLGDPRGRPLGHVVYRPAALPPPLGPPCFPPPPHHPPPHPHPQLLPPPMGPMPAYPLYPWLMAARHARPFQPRFLGGPDFAGFLLHPFRKPKRIRTAFSPNQLLKLEKAFENNHYVVGAERKQLAQSLGLSETQVKVWFQNRRTKHKRTEQEEEAKRTSSSGKRAPSSAATPGTPGGGPPGPSERVDTPPLSPESMDDEHIDVDPDDDDDDCHA